MARRAPAGTGGGLSAEPLVREDGNSRAVRTKLDAAGRIVIPAEFRQALGVGPGDHVLMRVLDGEVHVYTLDHVIERAQALFGSFGQDGRMLSEELIAERRAEAERD
jgi:antitoxin PrlF